MRLAENYEAQRSEMSRLGKPKEVERGEERWIWRVHRARNLCQVYPEASRARSMAQFTIGRRACPRHIIFTRQNTSALFISIFFYCLTYNFMVNRATLSNTMLNVSCVNNPFDGSPVVGNEFMGPGSRSDLIKIRFSRRWHSHQR